MLIRKPDDIAASEITPKSLYLNRRKFLAGTAATAAAVAGGLLLRGAAPSAAAAAPVAGKLPAFGKSSFSTDEKQTPLKDVTNYNNYYEFSTDKYGPAGLAKDFPTRTWTVKVEGLDNNTRTFTMYESISTNPLVAR